MNMFKRIGVYILAIILVASVSFYPMQSYASTVAKGDTNNNIHWELFSDGTMVISGSNVMDSFAKADNVCWMEYKPLIKSVVIKDGVKSVSSYAFSDCENLETVSIGADVKTFDYGCFMNCIKLKKVTIPDTVQSAGRATFKGCTGLTDVSLGLGISIIDSSMFDGCTALKSITIPDNVTQIESRAFRKCTSLEEVNLNNQLRVIGSWAFYKCSSLKNIVLPESISNIEASGFAYCENLRSISFDTQKDSLEYAIGSSTFENCTNLKNVSLVGGIYSIGIKAFYGCESLENIVLPEGLKTYGDFAFDDCSSLESIIFKENIPNMELDVDNDLSYYSGKIFYPCNNDEWTESIMDRIAPEGNWIPNHSKGNVVEVVSPTCVEDGYTEYTCSLCGANFRDDITNAKGHKWDEGTIIKEATCIESGTCEFKCTNEGCSETKCENIAAAHVWESDYTVDVAPTCTSVGVKSIHCSKCGEIKNAVIIPKEEHSYSTEIIAPTYGKRGYTKHICSKCGDIYYDDYIEALTFSSEDITIKLKTYNSITISWSSLTELDKADVYYKKVSDSKWTKKTVSGTGTVISSLSSGTKYMVKVMAGDVELKPVTYVTTLKKMTAPTIVKSTSAKVKVTWKKMDGASGYQISKSTKKTGTVIAYTVSNSASVSKVIKATKGKTYYYKIRAYKTVNGKKIYAPWSSVKSYKLK